MLAKITLQKYIFVMFTSTAKCTLKCYCKMYFTMLAQFTLQMYILGISKVTIKGTLSIIGIHAIMYIFKRNASAHAAARVTALQHAQLRPFIQFVLLDT